VFPEYQYVSLEERDSRQFAQDDPRGFLEEHSGPVIIDEAQRVPDLFSYIQHAADSEKRPGRFILTGSQNFLLMERVSQSLAGRTAILHLLPFERAELEGVRRDIPESPEILFNNTDTTLDLWDTVFCGFYPRIHDVNIPPDLWLSDYTRTYIERDLRSLVNIGNLENFERFLSLVAGRSSQILNYNALANDAGIALDTAKRWISVLKTSFIIFLLTPHHKNFNKRIIKSPKLYFYDTGLACHLLGIDKPEHVRSHPLRGALFENLIIAEVVKSFTHHRMKAPVYFWRDRTGHEIDLLLDYGGSLYPVEIKSGKTVSSGMFDVLRWWCKHAGRPLDSAYLVYGGDQAVRRNGSNVRPWFSV
jgi:hypothetical protein